MKLLRTAKIKLDLTVEQVMPTIKAYTNGYNLVSSFGFEAREFNSINLHKACYADLRRSLPAQLSISCRMRASDSLKSVLRIKNKYPSCPRSKQSSIRYDARSYSLFLKTNEVSLLALNTDITSAEIGMRKRIPISIPEYYKHYFDGWEYGSADLCISGKNVYLHVSFSKEIADVQPTGKLVGIDRGITNIAVSSNNHFWGGRKLKNLVNKNTSLAKQATIERNQICQKTPEDIIQQGTTV